MQTVRRFATIGAKALDPFEVFTVEKDLLGSVVYPVLAARALSLTVPGP